MKCSLLRSHPTNAGSGASCSVTLVTLYIISSGSSLGNIAY